MNVLLFCFISKFLNLTVQVVDNPDLWGGYLLGCYILDDSRVPLTVTDMLK